MTPPPLPPPLTLVAHDSPIPLQFEVGLAAEPAEDLVTYRAGLLAARGLLAVAARPG